MTKRPLERPEHRKFFVRTLDGWYAVCEDTYGDPDNYYSVVVERLLYFTDATDIANKLNELSIAERL